jgi:hypothetical protein
MNLKEKESENVAWIHLVQNKNWQQALANLTMNIP